MADGKMIKLSERVEKAVIQYSERKNVTIGEAANLLIESGIKRLAAVHRYMDKNKAPAKKAPAKKAPAKKAGKAKGPLGRKTKAAKAEATAATVQ